ncbi:hypothetical protein RND81_14G093500 [Saponaria officinalis]|uniref:Pentatricopeptide repeat-containing protein n=1 Tax=Saponaria officinalis TaxID=3572 RepID=A0AAW1GS11_SAPOF
MNFWYPSRWHLKIKNSKFASLQTLIHFKGFVTRRLQQCSEVKSLNNALRVLDLVSPKTAPNKNQQVSQLIQDFLQTRSKKLTERETSSDFASPEPRGQGPCDLKPSSVFSEDEPDAGVFGLHRNGMRIDCAMLSYAVSDCGFKGHLRCGTQLQCLAIRVGFFTNVYVGSSLISMYSKCGDLCSAKMVFDELPVRNVVSWTALISGFAQEFQIDVCLELYQQMKNSSLKPNDYTLTSLLSACIGCSSLGYGKNAHSQAILFGLDSYVHVANALISMYCKCGNVGDALCVFEAMHGKDIVSWNSMIAGYALHGLAWKAIDLFEQMKKLRVKPDSISFLGILSSCRHVGLVREGYTYFNSMVDYGVEPNLGHYSCIVDLLGRAGLVEEGRKFILGMPIKPNAVIWGSLLSSCRLHDNVWIGIEAAENRLALEPTCAATHVQLAKLYARVGLWDQVAKVWKSMKNVDLRTEPGYSCIEIGNEVRSFRADDSANSNMNEVLLMLDSLMDQMTSDSVPKIHEELDVDLCFLVS